jgi:multidrug resistance efflux pump
MVGNGRQHQPCVFVQLLAAALGNSSGNWVKVVQRIPLRVRVQNEPDKPPLRVGMSVELSVDTGHARGLPQFITKYL